MFNWSNAYNDIPVFRKGVNTELVLNIYPFYHFGLETSFSETDSSFCEQDFARCFRNDMAGKGKQSN